MTLFNTKEAHAFCAGLAEGRSIDGSAARCQFADGREIAERSAWLAGFSAGRAEIHAMMGGPVAGDDGGRA